MSNYSLRPMHLCNASSLDIILSYYKLIYSKIGAITHNCTIINGTLRI